MSIRYSMSLSGIAMGSVAWTGMCTLASGRQLPATVASLSKQMSYV